MSPARGNAEHVSQSTGQLLCQPSYVLAAGALVVEGFQGLFQQLGCRS
ncbi:hypothetical protein IHE55_08875 [Streptomyces pactum]|uniref:Uncharacterized protein n=1 Tax=Streptomyces pactum TaxID=68249 RepID=A0ABS0NI62_9ACTN|nr:hypothetical protein [Streptomyces pactum]